LGIDHVGIAVADVAAASGTFSRLTGQRSEAVEDLPQQAVRVCFVPGALSPSNPRFELLEPLGENTPLGRFLARRGEGLHHVCFAVDDIRGEIARLAAGGFALIDQEPRRGHGGLVAFLHPNSAHSVLIELLQRDAPDSRRRTVAPAVPSLCDCPPSSVRDQP
jgi:methylmalonyl-CoA epimerase